MPDTPDVNALVADVEDGLYRMAGHNAWAALRELATLAHKATPPVEGYDWRAVAECPGVPCNKPSCPYYDKPDDFSWTCSAPSRTETAAHIEALTARADEAETMCSAMDVSCHVCRLASAHEISCPALTAAREAVAK